jgi:hypothetical protein
MKLSEYPFLISKNFRVLFSILTFLFTSCVGSHIKVPEEKRSNLKELAVDWSVTREVPIQYAERIDEMMEYSIKKFNNSFYPYKLHRIQPGEQNYISFKFCGGKVTEAREKILGVGISLVGLLVVPTLFKKMSGSDIPVFFAYYPKDALCFNVSLSPNLKGNYNSSRNFSTERWSILIDKEKNIDKITYKTIDKIHKIISSL